MYVQHMCEEGIRSLGTGLTHSSFSSTRELVADSSDKQWSSLAPSFEGWILLSVCVCVRAHARCLFLMCWVGSGFGCDNGDGNRGLQTAFGFLFQIIQAYTQLFPVF